MKKKNIIILIIALILAIGCAIGAITIIKDKKAKEEERIRQEQLAREEHIKQINESYNAYVITNKDTILYSVDKNEVGNVSKDLNLELDELPENNESEYFKLKNYDMYIKYTDIDKAEKKEDKQRYKNYIPFNKSIVTTKDTKLYVDENTYYIVNDEYNLPIIIDSDKYYAIFDDKLIYVNKDSKVIDSHNSDAAIATSIPILNYHFVVNAEDAKSCSPSSICHSEEQFDSHIAYIKNNGFYSITQWELENFIDGKINLPRDSVSITIDDGWFVGRAILILQKYDVMATLFLIGSLAPVSDYASPDLEVHSHTYNLHNISKCAEGRSPLLCYDNNTLVEDLKKSRELLGGSTYFCYPFYEYNDHAIAALQQAGFTMALTGGSRRVTRGINKFKVPRYPINSSTPVSAIASIINN